MKKRIFIAIAILLTTAAALSAQKFERHNRWMIGGEIGRNLDKGISVGAIGIYGRQYSELFFLGVGFGAQPYVSKKGQITSIFENSNGNTFVSIVPPYRYKFYFPLYADMQINFSRKESPFFAEIKAGACVGFHLNRIRGTESSDELEMGMAGPLFGLGIGKRFALKNEGELNVVLGAEGIWGPYYMDMPVSLGIYYGF